MPALPLRLQKPHPGVPIAPPRARKREAAPSYARHHLRYRVGRRPPHQIRRGAAQNPVGPTLHRAILLPFSRPPAISRKADLFVAERDRPLVTRGGSNNLYRLCCRMRLDQIDEAITLSLHSLTEYIWNSQQMRPIDDFHLSRKATTYHGAPSHLEV